LLAAIVLLTLASVLCGSARSMLFPVIARGVQGIGGGILLGTVFAAVADLFPDPKLRLRWLVLVTSTFGARHRDHGRAARAFLRETCIVRWIRIRRRSGSNRSRAPIC
jgi:hypothetical protein